MVDSSEASWQHGFLLTIPTGVCTAIAWLLVVIDLVVGNMGDWLHPVLAATFVVFYGMVALGVVRCIFFLFRALMDWGRKRTAEHMAEYDLKKSFISLATVIVNSILLAIYLIAYLVLFPHG